MDAGQKASSNKGLNGSKNVGRVRLIKQFTDLHVSSRGKVDDKLLAVCGGGLFSLRVRSAHRPASPPPVSTATSDLTAAQYIRF